MEDYSKIIEVLKESLPQIQLQTITNALNELVSCKKSIKDYEHVVEVRTRERDNLEQKIKEFSRLQLKEEEINKKEQEILSREYQLDLTICKLELKCAREKSTGNYELLSLLFQNPNAIEFINGNTSNASNYNDNTNYNETRRIESTKIKKQQP